MEPKLITIIGGTGFLGRYVVRRLAKAGYRIRIIARNPYAALHLKTAGDVGQIALIKGNLTKPESLAPHLEGSYAVINLVGILFEAGRQSFTKLHAQGAEKLAKLAREKGVPRFIHVSSLGVDKATKSYYAYSKLTGEKAVMAAFPQATILRPGVIFGPEDNFYNQFARLASFFPILPLIGNGKTRFQPVYADDVAKAIEACLAQEETKGQLYELGGPETYSFRQILQYIMIVTGKNRRLIPLPFSLMTLAAAPAELLPRPPITRDQVTLLKYDNVVSDGAKTFADLGIIPIAPEMIVPDYLARFSKKAA